MPFCALESDGSEMVRIAGGLEVLSAVTMGARPEAIVRIDEGGATKEGLEACFRPLVFSPTPRGRRMAALALA